MTLFSFASIKKYQSHRYRFLIRFKRSNLSYKQNSIFEDQQDAPDVPEVSEVLEVPKVPKTDFFAYL